MQKSVNATIKSDRITEETELVRNKTSAQIHISDVCPTCGLDSARNLFVRMESSASGLRRNSEKRKFDGNNSMPSICLSLSIATQKLLSESKIFAVEILTQQTKPSPEKNDAIVLTQRWQ